MGESFARGFGHRKQMSSAAIAINEIRLGSITARFARKRGHGRLQQQVAGNTERLRRKSKAGNTRELRLGPP